MERSGLRSFMASAETRHAIDALSASSTLTIFAGAGVSKEAGLPAWSDLIDRVLREAARQSEPFRSLHLRLKLEGMAPPMIDAELARDAHQYARWMTATHGILGAAAVVKAWVAPNEYRRIIERCLYEPVSERLLPLEPGPTAIAVARLWQRRGPNGMHVVTTNYDLLLERALRVVGIPEAEIVTVGEAPSERDDRYVVVHLHGVVAEPGRSEPISTSMTQLVLAEDEFYTPSNDVQARQRREYCESLLSSTACLFVGTSFTDPNLLTYLYRSAAARRPESPRHHAVVVKQGDQPPQLDATATVLAAGRLAAAQRLDRMNVTALQPEFFCQTSHFLADIHYQPAADNPPFSARLGAWAEAAHEHGVLPTHPERFCARQIVVQPALAAAVAAITAALNGKPSLRCSDEQLALHVWAHDPRDDTLVFVARSDQQFFNPATLERHQIAMPMKRLVVEAVCSGVVLEASGDEVRSSRWRSMLVTPVVLADGAELADGTAIGAIPVGAIVLASDQDGPRGLSRLRSSRQDRADLIAALSRVGSTLLVPNSLEAE